MGKILKFLRFSSTEQRVLIQSFFLLSMIRMGLFVLPFKSLLTLVNNMKLTNSVRHTNNRILSNRITWAIEKASRYVPFTTCLSKAFALQVLFSKQGYSSFLRIGISKNENEQLEAHAWVECKGQVVMGYCPDFTRYKVMQYLDEKTI
jgi:Transglutaminase-like superfamily